MDEQGEIARNQAQQARLYGEPLGPLLRRLTASLGITQARLAELLGLSAPMLSQLASARRVKIGNPAVVVRLRGLIDLVDGGVPADRGLLEARLRQVQAAQAPLSGASTLTDETSLIGGLRATASPEQLAAAAQVVEPISAELAHVLAQAAGRSRHG
ncbi:DNA-binding protein [Luteipulveratus sp. YIM 133132]|uniref:helix-turn-helix domain-containing protein n=1 Tax=Luteipulveratus flavus TaxID=3031728 RepID=UPI0023AEA620|nr:DNA-binding protein [Luteipulveratus sp. YIM 133132]MDE9367038.1 DNA-binding protein [Luteipulveratus sp. YIM 133132]